MGCTESDTQKPAPAQGLSCYLCLLHFPPDLCIVSCFLSLRPQPERHSSGQPLTTSLCAVAPFISGCLVEYLVIGFFTAYLWPNLNKGCKGTRASSLPVTVVSPPLDKCLALVGAQHLLCEMPPCW